MRPISALLVSALAIECSGSSNFSPPTLTHLALAPAAVTLAPGGSQQFSVTGTWSDGSSSPPSVTYSATGGTITTGGLYTAGSTPGGYRAIATYQGGTLADTSAVTISASAATQLAITTQPSAAAQSGSAFAQQPVVQLRDASANPVSQAGVVVTAAIASGGGTLGGTPTATTNASGVATFTSLTITGTVGNRTLSFSAPGLTGATSTTIAISASSATQLAITTQPSAAAQSGVAFAQQPVVQLRDASANPVSQAGVVVTAAIASGGGTLGGTLTATTSASGVATFTNLSITGAAGDRTLSFSAPGLTGAASTTITISTSGGGTILFQEGYEDASLAGRGWYDLPAGGITSITTAEHHSGSASLEMDFAATGTSPSPAVAMRHLFTGSDAVYLRYWVKYSTNWVGTGTTVGPHEFLFMTNVDGSYIGPAYTHLTTYVEQNYQNGGIPRLGAQDGANVDTTRINVDLTGVTENRAVSGCNGNADGTPTTCYRSGSRWYNGKAWQAAAPTFLPNPGTGYKGDWHMVEVYYKLNSILTGIGQADGVAQYWFDGQLIIDRHNLLFRTGAHAAMLFNQFQFAPYMGSGSPLAQTMWLDDLVVMTAHP